MSSEGGSAAGADEGSGEVNSLSTLASSTVRPMTLHEGENESVSSCSMSVTLRGLDISSKPGEGGEGGVDDLIASPVVMASPLELRSESNSTIDSNEGEDDPEGPEGDDDNDGIGALNGQEEEGEGQNGDRVPVSLLPLQSPSGDTVGEEVNSMMVAVRSVATTISSHDSIGSLSTIESSASLDQQSSRSVGGGGAGGGGGSNAGSSTTSGGGAGGRAAFVPRPSHLKPPLAAPPTTTTTNANNSASSTTSSSASASSASSLPQLPTPPAASSSANGSMPPPLPVVPSSTSNVSGGGGSKTTGGGGGGPKVILSYTELLRRKEASEFDGLDPSALEDYLSKEEFQSVFGMSYEEYSKLPKWRQKAKKQEVKLF